MWIGELARLVILDLHRRKIMFRNIEKESMLFKEGLSTAFISQLTQYVFTKSIHFHVYLLNILLRNTFYNTNSNRLLK